MIDRIPTQILSNGAIRNAIYDENGTFLRYEWIKKDDEPTQAGTPINKANLLSDTTSQLIFSDSDDHTVNEALSLLKTNLNSLVKLTYGTYVGTGTSGQYDQSMVAFRFKPEIIVIGGGGSYDYGVWLYQDSWLMSSIQAANNRQHCHASIGQVGSNVYFSWYNTDPSNGSYYQFNTSNYKYFYIGIGEA